MGICCCSGQNSPSLDFAKYWTSFLVASSEGHGTPRTEPSQPRLYLNLALMQFLCSHSVSSWIMNSVSLLLAGDNAAFPFI